VVRRTKHEHRGKPNVDADLNVENIGEHAAEPGRDHVNETEMSSLIKLG